MYRSCYIYTLTLENTAYAWALSTWEWVLARNTTVVIIMQIIGRYALIVYGFLYLVRHIIIIAIKTSISALFTALHLCCHVYLTLYCTCNLLHLLGYTIRCVLALCTPPIENK